MAPLFKRLGLAASGLIAMLCGLAWFAGSPQSSVPRAPAGHKGAFHEVSQQPLSIKATIKGLVAAGKTVPVNAPFDGGVREKHVQFGDQVEVGDILVTMDRFEIETRLRDAQSAALKAAMALEQLTRWADGAEVGRAKRAAEAAESGLAKAERQAAEARGLVERGIISRNEYEGIVEQRDAQSMARVSAQDDLRAAMARGDAKNRRLAELEHTNAKLRLAELQDQFDGAVVRATVAGIVMRPPLNASLTASMTTTIEPGARVSRGQSIFSIADVNALVVVGRADENDVNALRVGMEVEIDSDAFPGEPISGRLTSVSAEADSAQTGKAPTFEVRALLGSVAPARRAAIRIGMSARMTVTLRSDPKAVQIPISAVRNAPTNPTVQILGSDGVGVSERSITLGVTTELGVEVLSGLQIGEKIALNRR